MNILDDQVDYQRFLDEYGLTEESIHGVIHNQADQIPMPEGFDGVQLQQSLIHGLGLFATHPFAADELLAPMRVNKMRTPAGRYTNHSGEPNAKMVRPSAAPDSDLYLVAISDIAQGAEILIDYRQACRANGNNMQPVELPAVQYDMVKFAELPKREQIASLTADLLADVGAHIEFVVRHSFAPGLYIREMDILAGQVVIGKIHKVSAVNICSRGRVDICTEKGNLTVTAGFVAVSAPGTQKLGFAHEDSTWVNVFSNPTNETDIDKLEAELVYTDEEAFALLDPEGKYFKVKELPCQSHG